MNQQAAPAPVPQPVAIAPQSFVQRHWRRILGIAVFALLAYVAGVEVLARLLVHFSAGAADANTRLNAVTSTRGALLGILTPLVVAFGGIAAFLNYQEVRGQNRRTNERAMEERDETRRLRRATVYADFLGASERCVSTALLVFIQVPGQPEFLENLARVPEERQELIAAHDRLRLLGADEVQLAADDLHENVGKIVKTAITTPKVADAPWVQVFVTDWTPRYKAFLDAARSDLKLTR